MNRYLIRPLSANDIRTIAAYLRGTREKLPIALSELGFNPALYTEAELLGWLRDEADLVKCPKTGVWRIG